MFPVAPSTLHASSSFTRNYESATDTSLKADSPARSFTSFIYRGTRDLSFTRVIRLEAQCCLRKRTKCRVCPQSALSLSSSLLVFLSLAHLLPTLQPTHSLLREFTYNQDRSFRDNVVGTDGKTVCANASSPSGLSRIYYVGLPSASASPYPLKIKAEARNYRGEQAKRKRKNFKWHCARRRVVCA